MLLGDARISDERTSNIRGTRIEAFGREQIRISEERPQIHNLVLNNLRLYRQFVK